MRVGTPAGALFGGQGQLAAHVALFPLVRVGVYGLVEGTSVGTLGGGGGRVKLYSPWPRVRNVRPYLFAGAGAAGGAGGAWFEVPVGLGAAWVLNKPWELTFETGARIGQTTALGLSVGIAFGG